MVVFRFQLTPRPHPQLIVAKNLCPCLLGITMLLDILNLYTIWLVIGKKNYKIVIIRRWIICKYIYRMIIWYIHFIDIPASQESLTKNKHFANGNTEPISINYSKCFTPLLATLIACTTKLDIVPVRARCTGLKS